MFEMWKSEKDHQFYWHLKAANGEIVAASEAYTTKEACTNGMEAVKTAAKDDHFVDLTIKSPDGRPGAMRSFAGLDVAKWLKPQS